LASNPALERYDETVQGDLDRPFAVTGRRAFLIGHMDGSFPDIGHHLPGEMGGLWAYPIKLADGFWFGIAADQDSGTTWMYGPNCHSFTMKMGRVSRRFSVSAGALQIKAEQEIWVPERETGVLISVTLTNASPQPCDLLFKWLARFDIQGAWWSGWPDRVDEAATEMGKGAILVCDTLHREWAACMLGSQTPDGYAMGGELWGPQRTWSLDGRWGAENGGIIRNPDELQGGGVSGQTNFAVNLPANGSKTLHFCIAGGVEGTQRAYEKASDLLARREALLAEKLSIQEQVASRFPSIHTPRLDLNRAFDVQNPCMDMLTMELPGVGYGLTAGLHGFGWFFGCDTYYSVDGYIVAGQSGTALGNLRLLADFARKQGGRVPHEITPTGVIFNPGNSVETGEYAIAVERAFRWTSDLGFLREVYGVCKQGLFDYLLGACDPNGDLLPDGAGLLELTTAEHGKKLDVACALYEGLKSLAYLAGAMGDEVTVERSRSLAGQVKSKIEQHFWVPERQEYVWRIEPDLSVVPGEPAHSYVTLEMGLLDGSDMERVRLLFDGIEGPEHTGPRGVIHPGIADFVMPIQNAIIALAEFRYGRPDKGLWYLERMAELAGHYMPWAIPEFVGRLASFLQAWSSAAYNWLLVQGFFRLNPDPSNGLIVVQPQLPSGWNELEVSNLTIWGKRYDLRLQRAGEGYEFTATPCDGEQGAARFEVVTTPDLPVTFA
jgi:hypothetical protein